MSGTYADYLKSRGLPVPAWVWINGLAHGGLAEVKSAAATRHVIGSPEALIAEIACCVLRALQRGAALEMLQRNTLIPLELALAARAGRAPTDSVELARSIKAVSATRLRPMPTAGPKR